MADELLKLVPDENELAQYRAYAVEQRRQTHFAYLEASATEAEWQAKEVDPNNFPLANERSNFIAAAAQRKANLAEKYAFWDARVKQYAEPKPAQGKPA